MEGFASLLGATAAFVGSHFLLSHPLRPALAGRLGERGFAGVYSAVALVTFAWLFRAAIRAPTGPLWWVAPQAVQDLATLVTLVAAILLAGSLIGNPALVDPGLAPAIPARPRGVLAITRHPMMWGVTLWALTHAVLWGSAANLIVTAGLFVLAFFGARAQDRKKERLLGPAWTDWEARTSFWPFGAQFTGRAPWRAALPGPGASAGGLALWLIATDAHAWLGGPVAGPWRWFG